MGNKAKMKWDATIYRDWVRKNRPDYEVLGQYINTSTKIEHLHVNSQLTWECTPEKFRAGVSHPEISRGCVLKRTPEQYVQWVKKNRSDYIALEKYINVKTKIKHQHIESGIIWECSPGVFMKGSSPTELTTCERWDVQKYSKYLKNTIKTIELVGSFTTQSTPTAHKCLVNDTTFNIAPMHIIKNLNYKYVPKIHNTITYKQWLLNNRPGLKLIEPYIKSNIKINHIDTKSGSVWCVKPNNVIQGQYHPIHQMNSTSRVSINWLSSIERKENITIQHKLNGGEFKIPNIGHVDGYYAPTKTVYEFHGDFWHGNPTKFNKNDINPVNYKSFGLLYENTIKREQKIKQAGYHLVSVWEADFDK